jgi:hypothetical protein
VRCLIEWEIRITFQQTEAKKEVGMIHAVSGVDVSIRGQQQFADFNLSTAGGGMQGGFLAVRA